MKLLKIIAVLVLALMGAACSKVPAGNVGIKVYLLGSNKGVDHEDLGPGNYWIGWNEELYVFPTFTQNYVWTKSATEGSPTDESISFQTVEGMSVSADVGISYAVIPEKVPAIFQKYRKQLDEITHIYLRNMVRDAFVHIASTKPVEDVYGVGKANLLTAVEEYVRAQCGDMFKIERIYLVGDLRLPPQVTNSLNLKIQATQQAQQVENEIRTARAEAEKKIAEAEGSAKSLLVVAESQAQANKVLSDSLTPQFIQYQALKQWNGVLPTTMLPNGAVPFVGVK
jgi:regulator of protease activity HflC (stomatin/prohibitin superfamily)